MEHNRHVRGLEHLIKHQYTCHAGIRKNFKSSKKGASTYSGRLDKESSYQRCSQEVHVNFGGLAEICKSAGGNLSTSK